MTLFPVGPHLCSGKDPLLKLKITMVVRLNVVSEFAVDPPDEDWADDRININGPLYELCRVVDLAIRQLEQNEQTVILWTRKAISDAQKWHGCSHTQYKSDIHFISTLIYELQKRGKYLKSEWCRGQGTSIAACDAYRLNRIEKCPETDVSHEFEYYLKFAIGKTGRVILSASNHL